MAGVGMLVSYDSEADIFELVEDPSKEYVSREIEHGFFLHLDPKTGRIVGFALHHFSQRYTDRPKSIPLIPNFKLKETAAAQR